MSEMISRRSMMMSLPVVTTTMVGTVSLVAALAMSAWSGVGWGSVVWLASLVVQLTIRTPHLIRNRSNPIAVRRADRPEQCLLAVVSLTGLALPLIYVSTGFLAAADYVLPDWATTAGAMLQIPSLWLFWRSHADLGRNWSPGLEVREGHTLASRGVYARVRHPMYDAIGLSLLSQALLIPNGIAGALALPAFAALLVVRIPREEAMMRDTLGDAYAAYAAQTPRLVPRIWE